MLNIKLNQGEKCQSNAALNYVVNLQVDCDDTMKDGEFALVENKQINLNDCELKIQAKSKHGCSLINYYAVEAFLNKNNIAVTKTKEFFTLENSTRKIEFYVISKLKKIKKSVR